MKRIRCEHCGRMHSKHSHCPIFRKMESARIYDLVRLALIYGAQDREEFAGCYRPGTPEAIEASKLAREFNELRMKYFGGKTEFEKMLAVGKLVTLDELKETQS